MNGVGGLGSVGLLTTHSVLLALEESMSPSRAKAKNVDLLQCLEAVCLSLQGCRITFCKSGKWLNLTVFVESLLTYVCLCLVK